MADAPVDLTVVHNEADNQFEIYVGGELGGFAAYRPLGNTFSFTHTEIDEEYAGRGLGQTLVTGALDAIRERGLTVLPFCPFVRSFLLKNPEYLDLVPAKDRERFGLPVDDTLA